jgi:hypothetical protein
MRTFLTRAFAAGLLAAPLFAGTLWLQADDVNTHPEAAARQAVAVVRMGACHEPEKTKVTGTAAGVVDGKRQTIPLHVIHLSDPNTLAVTQEWPQTGTWVVTLTVTNPNYRNYAPSIAIPFNAGTAQIAAAKNWSHAPTDDEISVALKNASL